MILTTATPEEVYLTCSEAGREVRPPVSGHRIRQMVDRGELHALKTPSGWRLVPLAEIRRLNESRQIQTD
jgi:PHP family Zn ribbon phosphoesterase